MKLTKIITKIVLYTFILVLLFVIALPYGLYRYGLSSIAQKEIPNTSFSLPAKSSQALWSALGETGEIQFEKANPYLYIYRVLTIRSTSFPFFRGDRIASRLARLQITHLKGTKRLSRMLAELSYTIWISKNISADQALSLIAEKYYFGNGHYGIDKASMRYFGKKINQLSICENALISSITIAPSRFDPIKFPQKTKNARDKTLNKMKENGFITENEMQQCINSEIKVIKSF